MSETRRNVGAQTNLADLVALPGAAAAIVLSAVALARSGAHTMAAAAAICLGVALLGHGAMVARRMFHLGSPIGVTDEESRVGEAASDEVFAGACAIAFGALALFEVAPLMLIAIAAMAVGGALVFAGPSRPRVPHATPEARRAALEPTVARSEVQPVPAAPAPALLLPAAPEVPLLPAPTGVLDAATAAELIVEAALPGVTDEAAPVGENKLDAATAAELIVEAALQRPVTSSFAIDVVYSAVINEPAAHADIARREHERAALASEAPHARVLVAPTGETIPIEPVAHDAPQPALPAPPVLLALPESPAEHEEPDAAHVVVEKLEEVERRVAEDPAPAGSAEAEYQHHVVDKAHELAHELKTHLEDDAPAAESGDAMHERAGLPEVEPVPLTREDLDRNRELYLGGFAWVGAGLAGVVLSILATLRVAHAEALAATAVLVSGAAILVSALAAWRGGIRRAA